MLCWSWVFGYKMLNLPKGTSGNYSREVFYACMTLVGVVQWRKISLEVQLSFLFLSQPFFHRLLLPTNWKGACGLEEGLGYVLWPSRQTTQLFDVDKKCQTPLSTKIILLSYEQEVYCLCYSSASTNSLQVPLTSVQSRGMRQDSQNSGEEGSQGDPNFPHSRCDCAYRVEAQVHSFATAWPTLSFVSLVKISFIHAASLLTCQIFPRFAPLLDT